MSIVAVVRLRFVPAAVVVTLPENVVVPVPAVCVRDAASNVELAVTSVALTIVTAPSS